jgi:hypothetical protein
MAQFHHAVIQIIFAPASLRAAIHVNVFRTYMSHSFDSHYPIPRMRHFYSMEQHIHIRLAEELQKYFYEKIFSNKYTPYKY